MKNSLHLLYLTFIPLTLLVACGNPVEEVKVANSPSELRTIWEDYQYMRQEDSFEADEFNSILNQKLKKLFKQASTDPDTKFLLERRKEELSQRPVQYNIVIVPDLSSRINPEYHPLQAKQDIKIIETLLDVYEDLVRKKYIGQKDRIILRPTDKSQVYNFNQYAESLNIDFSAKALPEKGSYLDSLEQHKKAFLATAQGMYNDALKDGLKGADVWRFFNEDLDSSVLRQSTETDSVRNIIILLTDGYIEAGKYGEAFCQENKCEYLSSRKIQEFRKAIKTSGQHWEQVFEDKNFGILPVANKDNLKNVEVMALGFGDRDTKTHPTDYVIMKKFWDQWFKEIGVHGMVDKNRSAIEDSKNIITHFIEG